MKFAAGLLAPALVVACLVAGPADAADIAPEPAPGDWRFTLAPYAWATGINGDAGFFGREPVEIDMSFSDVLEKLDFAAMGVAEAHNGTWGLLADVDYANLSADGAVSRAVSADPPITAELKGSLEIREFMATVMGQWRALDQGSITLDLMGGARYWHVDTDFSLRLKANGEKLKSGSGSDGAAWIDPMIGAKARIDTGTPFYVTSWGMAGGFGAGSDFSWDVMGGLGYQWTEHFSTMLGYRAVGVDYEEDGFVYDVIQSGAVIGGVVSF